MKSIKSAIPSLITCLAILSGCISIISSINNQLTHAAYFIIVAAVLDFLDGMFARGLNAITAFGKQMDSLADAINFGVAPAMIMYMLMSKVLDELPIASGFAYSIFQYLPFLIVIFAVLRLAKFNIDETQTKSFRGLPSPANALFIASLGAYSESDRLLPFQPLTTNLWFIVIIIVLLSVLMVVNIRMFSLKFETYGLKNNGLRYIMLLSALIILILTGIPGIAPVILIYMLLAIGNNIFTS